MVDSLCDLEKKKIKNFALYSDVRLGDKKNVVSKNYVH